ncbi:MAG: hypothetical protein PVI74_14675, partial [Syntrophobacterales bacterium]
PTSQPYRAVPLVRPFVTAGKIKNPDPKDPPSPWLRRGRPGFELPPEGASIPFPPCASPLE